MKSWEGVGEAYARTYAALCAETIDPLITALQDADGRRLLDVGAGTGELAARFAAEGWHVIGCEPEATMRAVAARVHPDLALVDAALPQLPFSDAAFDGVTANFVLNHVSDPRAAAAEMRRVGASGGRLAATVWVESPSWFWREVCVRAALEPAPGERLAPEKDFPRTAQGFAVMLGDTGWGQVSAREMSWTWRPTAAALWRSAEGGVASAGLFYRGLDAEERQRFRRGFDSLCAERADRGTVPLAHTAAVAVGRPA